VTMVDRMPPVSSAESLVGQPLPDLTLTDQDGKPYALRQHIGRSQLVLFFYILNGTPG